MIVFLVSCPDPRLERPQRSSHAIVSAYGREGAKVAARSSLGGDPDKYTVSPLTAPGDSLRIDVEFDI